MSISLPSSYNWKEGVFPPKKQIFVLQWGAQTMHRSSIPHISAFSWPILKCLVSVACIFQALYDTCQKTEDQMQVSDFDYLNYFLNNAVIVSYKREKNELWGIEDLCIVCAPHCNTKFTF